MALPVEILELVIEAIATPSTLLNLTCTCSRIKSILDERMPLKLYSTDARFQTQRLTDPAFKSKHPATQPSLIYAIQNEGLDKIKTILDIFQKELSVGLTDRWDLTCFPTPIEAAITAHRVDVFLLLVEAGCSLMIGDREDRILALHLEYFRYPDSLNFVEDFIDPYMFTQLTRDNRHQFRRPLEETLAYALACAEGQEEIAIYLMETILPEHRYNVWVAVKFELPRVLDVFRQSVYFYDRDPLALKTFQFAVSAKATKWLASFVERTLAFQDLIPWDLWDDAIKLIILDGLYDEAAAALRDLTYNRLFLGSDIAALAVATDEGLPVAQVYLYAIRDTVVRRSMILSPKKRSDWNPEWVSLQVLQEFENLIFEESRRGSQRIFRCVVGAGGPAAMKYLHGLIDNGDATQLLESLPPNVFLQECDSTCDSMCGGLHQMGETQSCDLLGHAITAESWDCAFLLFRLGIDPYFLNCEPKDVLLSRLGSIRCPGGEIFSEDHLDRVLNQTPIPPADPEIFLTQSQDLFVEQLLTLYRLCIGDRTLLKHLSGEREHPPAR
ncbi:hypothetical protein F4802DRAFT_618505 [Xylaria palmicola]|nr:hypothetical protein F4802DRAFT_618505 [Xylaria palmicola]